MNAVIDALFAEWTTRGEPPPSSAGIVAVSGGRDSMVLLHALGLEAGARGWRLVVAHLNHGWRGAAADADVAFVADAAGRRGLEFVSERVDTDAARRSGESREMAARRLRHAFLAKVARDRGCAWIALGHHGGDQAELFLQRLLRGTGAAGLGGMRSSSPSPADPGVRLVRPFLSLESGQVGALAEHWGLTYREDATNVDLEYGRNRVRHELMPYLRRHFQPALERVLVREQVLLRDQSEFLEGLALEWSEQETEAGRAGFDALPVALQREVLRLRARDLGSELDFEKLERLRTRPGVPVDVDADRRCVADGRGGVCLVSGRDEAPGFSDRNLAVDLTSTTGDGVVAFGGGTLRWETVEHAGGAVSGPARGGRSRAVSSSGTVEECFDADVLGPRVVLRHWQPGDRFEPIGLGANAKVQDLWTSARVPSDERRTRVIAQIPDGPIFWIDGLRIGECAKVGERTRRILIWRWDRGAGATA